MHSFIVYNSELCIYHHNQFKNILIIPQQNPVPLRHHPLHLSYPALGNYKSIFCLHRNLPILDITYNGIIQCVVLCEYILHSAPCF
jgi:hypothetical protein